MRWYKLSGIGLIACLLILCWAPSCAPPFFPVGGMRCTQTPDCGVGFVCAAGVCVDRFSLERSQNESVTQEPRRADAESTSSETARSELVPPEDAAAKPERRPESPAERCGSNRGRLCPEQPSDENSCGNGICDPDKGENCAICAEDCKCPVGKSCIAGRCESKVMCGDGRCDKTEGENCDVCDTDCTCGKGLVCVGQACISPKQCSSKTACPQGFRCDKNGRCESLCPDVLDQEWRCNAKKTDRERCGLNTKYKKELESCKYGCREVIGSDDTCCLCRAGEARCRGDVLEICNADCLGWTKRETCKSGDYRRCDAKAGTCVCVHDCPKDEKVCKNKNDLRVCAPNRYGCRVETKSTCPSTKPICNKGSCCLCEPGASRCKDQQNVEVCQNDCLGWKTGACAIGERCDKGRCGQCLCVKGQFRCGENNSVERCKSDCSGWEKIRVCAPGERCDGQGGCRTCACTSEMRRCKGKTIQFCDSTCSGWKDVVACSSSQYCDAGACKACVCTPNAKRCSRDSRSVETCKADCSGWVKTSCGGNQRCRNNQCQNCACSPGKVIRCVGLFQERVCRSDCFGTFKRGCFLLNPCRRGRCR